MLHNLRLPSRHFMGARYFHSNKDIIAEGIQVLEHERLACTVFCITLYLEIN